jgi:hypothetical protein
VSEGNLGRFGSVEPAMRQAFTAGLMLANRSRVFLVTDVRQTPRILFRSLQIATASPTFRYVLQGSRFGAMERGSISGDRGAADRFK